MSSKKGQPSIDPYDVLGIAFGASDTEITKAYRKLALQLHPDKQKSGLSPKEQEEIAKRFHDIKEARAFLLEAEHAEDKRQYDAKRESVRVRREADVVREQHMSVRRKRMRDELKEKEAEARQQSKKQQRKDKADKDLVDQLRKEGQQRREEQAQRDAEREIERELRKEREQRKVTLEDRQVRLKWDRKKIKISPSEHSIASLMSEFGTVETVEFLGKKGNQALVTFADASSCRPCVDAYASSKEMRAKFVGQRKEQEDNEDDEEAQQQNEAESAPSWASKTRDFETLEERRLRQAAEREALLREMQDEREEVAAADTSKVDIESKSSRKKDRARTVPFPLPFPDNDELRNLLPYQKLERMENDILRDLISPEQLLSLRITTTRQ